MSGQRNDSECRHFAQHLSHCLLTDSHTFFSLPSFLTVCGTRDLTPTPQPRGCSSSCTMSSRPHNMHGTRAASEAGAQACPRQWCSGIGRAFFYLDWASQNSFRTPTFFSSQTQFVWLCECSCDETKILGVYTLMTHPPYPRVHLC